MRRRIAIVAMLAVAIGVQAQVKLKPDNAETAGLDSYTYTIPDVSARPVTVTGSLLWDVMPADDLAFSQTGEGAVSVTYTGLYGYDSAAAVAATNDFGAYLSTLSAAKVAVNSDDWGVDASDSWADTHPERINTAEVGVFTFDTSGLTAGELVLDSVKMASDFNNDVIDFIVYYPASNRVEEVLLGQMDSDGNASYTFTSPLRDGAMLLVALTTAGDHARVDSIVFDLVAPLSTNLQPVYITDVASSNVLVELEWSDDRNQELLDYYNVYRSLSATGTFSVVGTPTSSAYTDMGVMNNETYYYRVEAVGTNGLEYGYANSVSGTPAVPVPTGLVAVSGNAEVSLSWDPSIDYLFDSFTVYRATMPSTNYYELASGVITNTFVDTTVLNGASYSYSISQVDTSADESALSIEMIGVPTSDLVLVNLSNGTQGSARALTNGATYEVVGSTITTGNMRAGQFAEGIPYLSRLVLKFPLVEDQITEWGKTTNDIDRVVLRMYLSYNFLVSEGLGSAVDVYAAHTTTAGDDILPSDFESESFSRVGEFPGLIDGAPVRQWYEIDVTDQVLADLALGDTLEGAGSAFRLQLTDDTSLTNAGYQASQGSTNIVNSSIIFVDNAGDVLSAQYRPQLRIIFSGSAPSKFRQWAELWKPADVSAETEDYDGDGLNNLYEYGLNSNPTNAAVPASAPTLTKVGEAFEYIHPMRSDDDTLIYTVKTTTDLASGTWDSVGYTVDGTNFTDGPLNEVTNTIDTVEDNLFIRLIIE